jgi:hypothetical protein
LLTLTLHRKDDSVRTYAYGDKYERLEFMDRGEKAILQNEPS